MKVFKIILKLLLFLFIGLVIAAVVIPIIYKDDIVAGVKNAINDNVNAKVDFESVDLTVISSFPNAGIKLNQLVIDGVNEFDGINLALVKDLTLEVSLPSLINSDQPLELREVTIDEAQLNILTKKNGKANYLIMKETEAKASEGNFIMRLNKYNLKNSKITYRDEISNQAAVVQGINHTGSGQFYNEQFDLDTETTIDQLTFKNGGVAYLNKAKAKADAVIAVDLGKNKYTLKDNDITINAMDVNVDGYAQLNENDIAMDMKFSAPSESARGIMSIIPGVYSSNFDNVKVDGKAAFSGMVKGKYDGTKGIFPAVNITSKITDGFLQYPSLPKAVKNIDMDILVKADQGNYDDMIINIPTLSMLIGENKIAGALTTKNLNGDPAINGYLNGKVILDDWKSALPAEGIEQLSGIINADIQFDGKQSDITNQNFKALTLTGDLTGENIVLKTKDQPAINIREVSSKMSPDLVVLSTTDATAGQSDFVGDLEVKNPLAYFVNEGNMETKLVTRSKKINADEWLTAEPTEPVEKTVIPEQLANVDLNIKSDQIVMNGYDMKAVTFEAAHGNNAMQIKELSGTIGSSDFNLKGDVQNTLGYFNEGKELKGQLVLESNNLKMEDFMQETSESASKEIVPVPENMDITIASTIGTATYDKINLNQLKGDITVKDRQVALEKGVAKGLGGLIKFSGLYGTPEGEKPDFAFKYDLSDLAFEETVASVDMTQQLVPIMKFIKGSFNSTLVMEGKLNDNMFPDLNTLDASGYLETISGKLQELDIANKMANLLGIDALRKLDFDHTKNWFEVVDGMVELKPFEKNVVGIDMALSGSHGLGKSMNYALVMNVPRELLKKNVVTGAVEAGLGLLESQAAKLGVNIEQGDFIKIKADISGSINSPNIKLTPLGSGGKATMKDVVTDKLDDIKETVKDSVKTVIEDTKQQVKDSIDSTVKIVKDSIKTVADETVETVKDSVKTVVKDVVEDVVEDQIDKVLKDSAAQEVKDKLEDVINESTGKTADEIKDKLEDWNPFKKKKKKD